MLGMMGPGPAMPALPLPADWQDVDDSDQEPDEDNEEPLLEVKSRQ